MIHDTDPARARVRAGWLGTAFVSVVSLVYGWSLIVARWGYQASADSYYHFAVAREIAHGQLRSELQPRLPWTILLQWPVDHYFGFHLLLAPLAALPDALWGLKLATLVFFMAVPLAVFWFLHARGVPFAWAWCFAPVLFSNQDWRYLMLRGGNWLVVLSIVLLQLAFFTPNRLRRRMGIVLVSYVATLSYQGGVILLPLHVTALLSACVLCFRYVERERLWEPLLTALGLSLGFLLNPYMNASAATLRLLWFHVAYMNLDPAGLYPGLREFGPVPLAYLSANPELIVAPVCLLLAASWVLYGLQRRRPPSYAVAVLLGAALVGLVLTARAIRMREYSVPWAVLFFALFAGQWRFRWQLPLLRRIAAPALGVFVCILLLLKWPSTFELLGEHLPHAQYAGARALLEAYRGPPVLNIAEGDYTTLRWEDPNVATVQGLSHYFLYPNRPIFDDVTLLRESASPAARLESVRRFYERGVRLLAVQHRNSAFALLERYPNAFRLAYRSSAQEVEPRFRSSIYVLDRIGLEAALVDAHR
ncbi:MAG: hypothetical protein ABIQ16_14965 [Polyangiaceae bacterium]